MGSSQGHVMHAGQAEALIMFGSASQCVLGRQIAALPSRVGCRP